MSQIKIKHFRRGAHSNGGNTCFWQRWLTAKQLLRGEEGKKNCKNSTWARSWTGLNWVGPWALVDARKQLEKAQGATRLGATGLRASEREICLWEGLWEGLWKPLTKLWRPLKKTLKTSQRKTLWKPLKPSKNLWKICKPPSPLKKLVNLPLRDPLRGRFPSQRLSVLLPLFICPLPFLQNNMVLGENFLQDPFWSIQFNSSWKSEM